MVTLLQSPVSHFFTPFLFPGTLLFFRYICTCSELFSCLAWMVVPACLPHSRFVWLLFSDVLSCYKYSSVLYRFGRVTFGLDCCFMIFWLGVTSCLPLSVSFFSSWDVLIFLCCAIWEWYFCTVWILDMIPQCLEQTLNMTANFNTPHVESFAENGRK